MVFIFCIMIIRCHTYAHTQNKQWWRQQMPSYCVQVYTSAAPSHFNGILYLWNCKAKSLSHSNLFVDIFCFYSSRLRFASAAALIVKTTATNSSNFSCNTSNVVYLSFSIWSPFKRSNKRIHLFQFVLWYTHTYIVRVWYSLATMQSKANRHNKFIRYFSCVYRLSFYMCAWHIHSTMYCLLVLDTHTRDPVSIQHSTAHHSTAQRIVSFRFDINRNEKD